MSARAFICGVSGLDLTGTERRFLREADPWGLILFKRNVDSPEQVKRLVGSFREVVGRDEAPVLIDQEGGRVQRLGPPHWPNYPPGREYGRIYDRDRLQGLAAARLGSRLMAADLAALGISVDCLPVADVPIAGSDAVIGDRAYGVSAAKVAAIASAIAEGLRAGGVLPVAKHIPGHGRAIVDSHAELPTVDVDRTTLERTDFATFRALNHLPLAMTAHVVFSAIDPVAPATISATIVHEVIRGSIGFDGVLMTDDISMGALGGTMTSRVRASIAAGCDIVLHCNGRIDEMRSVAAAVPVLDGETMRRAAAALARRRPPEPVDLAAARTAFLELLSGADPADPQALS
jgi:beta-N-acetylhexosaminidase